MGVPHRRQKLEKIHCYSYGYSYRPAAERPISAK